MVFEIVLAGECRCLLVRGVLRGGVVEPLEEVCEVVDRCMFIWVLPFSVGSEVS